MAQFQLTSYEKDEVRKLLGSINKSNSPPCVGEPILDKAFDRWWPDLEASLDPLLSEVKSLGQNTQSARRVDQSAILEELLELMRDQHRMLTLQDRPLSERDVQRLAGQLRHLVRGNDRNSREEDEMVHDAIEYAYNHLAAISERVKAGELPPKALQSTLDELRAPIGYAMTRLAPARARRTIDMANH